MIQVSDILKDAKRIYGFCDLEELYKWVGDAIELLANKGDWDALTGFVDICLDGKCITLPSEIETVLAVNIGGRPTLGRDQLFNFHLNGPGDCSVSCRYSWTDRGDFPTYRELKCPSKLIAFVDSPEDTGKSIRVYGYDRSNNWVRQQSAIGMEDGWQVPTIYGYAVPEADAPVFSRIVRVRKDPSVAAMRLVSFDSSSSTGTVIGIYQSNETDPQYRRIELSRSTGGWARLAFRRRTMRVQSLQDHIPLNNRLALLLAMRAVREYDNGDIAQAASYEAHATRLATEEQFSRNPAVSAPIQVDDRNGLSDKGDYVD